MQSVNELTKPEQLIDAIIQRSATDLTVHDVLQRTYSVCAARKQGTWFLDKFSVAGWEALIAGRLEACGWKKRALGNRWQRGVVR